MSKLVLVSSYATFSSISQCMNRNVIYHFWHNVYSAS